MSSRWPDVKSAEYRDMRNILRHYRCRHGCRDDIRGGVEAHNPAHDLHLEHGNLFDVRRLFAIRHGLVVTVGYTMPLRWTGDDAHGSDCAGSDTGLQLQPSRVFVELLDDVLVELDVEELKDVASHR